MRKLLLVLSLFLTAMLSQFAQAQIPCESAANVTVVIGPLYYAEANILNTTATESDFTFSLVSSASDTAVDAAGGLGFEYLRGGCYAIGVPGKYLTRSTVSPTRLVYESAECIPGWETLIIRDSNAHARQTTGADPAGLTIPSTGMTLPEFSIQRTGETGGSRKLIIRGLGNSSATPELAMRIMADNGNDTPLAYETDLSYATYNFHTDILGSTPIVHLFSYTIPDSFEKEWYSVLCAVNYASRVITRSCKLILDTTPSIDTSSLVALSEWNNFVEGVTESIQDLRSGHPATYTIYTLENTLYGDNLLRAQAGRFVPQNKIYMSVVTYTDRFSGASETEYWKYDYDENTYADYTISSGTLSIAAQAIVDNATVSPTP